MRKKSGFVKKGISIFAVCHLRFPLPAVSDEFPYSNYFKHATHSMVYKKHREIETSLFYYVFLIQT